jgi:uncharacterized protein (DUF1330 family)
LANATSKELGLMSLSDCDVFLDPSDQNVRELFSRRIPGPITMLNLLRLRDTADYIASPDLAPASPISGRKAYDKYIEHTLPYLRATGGELLYLGVGGHYLIGPEGSGWDLVMLVRQSSLEDFLSFASDEGYLQGVGHRTAAVWDSRILPLQDAALSG